LKRIARKKEELCLNCGFCGVFLHCLDYDEGCNGCGACLDACPARAIYLERLPDSENKTVIIDGQTYRFADQLTILQALVKTGYKVSHFPEEGQVYAPCRMGGCWSCTVLVDGALKPSCVTPVKGGMEIITDRKLIEERPPLRMVASFKPHPVGGVGTPHRLRKKQSLTDPPYYTEVGAFTQGCILRCPTCQNWPITYASRGTPLTPEQAANIINSKAKYYNLKRIAFSGGESTINRRWLIDTLKNLKELNTSEVKLHIDTNGVLLTPDYIDQLIAAGMTDIGVDIKAPSLDTFKKVTGIKSPALSRRLLELSWAGIEYLLKNCDKKIFFGLGIVYNRSLIPSEELKEIAGRIVALNPSVQVCLLDYRPEFRQRDIVQPSAGEMFDVWKLLKKMGLECVLCQTTAGYYGP
jgi:pyruvate formate lyase activating enzyme